MTLPELSVRRPVVAYVVALLIFAIGAAAAFRLPVREYPDIDPPRVSVSIVYPGASAEVVERDVTQIVEDNLNGIEGVELIDSTARAGLSQTTVEFVLTRDLDAAAADVRDRVSAVRSDLPDEAEDAVIRKAATAESQAMMWLTLTSDIRDRRALTDVAIRVFQDPLGIVDGVSRVIIGGERRYAMRVWLDRGLMAARGVTVADVTRALQQENLEAPAGRIETDTREFTVRTETKLPDVEAFDELVLRDLEGGQVRLGDVARIELGAENYRSAVFRSGEPAVGLGIIRQSGSNTLAVAERVKAEIERLRPVIPPDVSVAVSYDQSLFIEGSIRSVIQTLLITVGLVIAVVYLSLGSLKATLAPAVTIPVAAVGCFAMMYALGFTINTLTLLALVLAIGLVVDDAIVVVENVTRRREEGEAPLAAGVLGASEVFVPVVATTAVLVAVLLPIAALTGTVGRLFTEFAITLATAVVLSSFLALSVGATLASKVREPGANWATRRTTAGLAWLETRYAALSRRLTAAPWLAAIFVVVLGASGWLLLTSLPSRLAPTEDRATFIAPVTAPEGATLAETLDAVERIREILEPYAGDGGPVEQTISIVGTGDVGPPQVDSGLVIVKLKPWGEREMSQQELVNEVSGAIASIPGAQAVAINPASLVSESFGKPVQIVVGAPDYDDAYAWAQTLRDRMAEWGTVRSLRVEFNRENPRILVTLDRRLAADLGLSVAEIGEALRVFLGGDDVTEFFRDGETYEVMVRGDPADRDDPAELGALQVRAGNGALIPLATVVETTVEGAPASYRRIDRLPSVVISGAPAEGADLGSILSRAEETAAEALPPEARISFLGLSREFTQSSGGTIGVFALALLVVYLTLAALFGSFLQPLSVMLAVPLALTAALAALWAAGMSFNIFSQIGLLLAVGLLAKNAILVVNFANNRRKEGMELVEATRKAARTRFRPVVMTSIATLFGAVPLAIATGPGAESRSVIGVTVLAGVTGATLITLLIVPSLYRLFAARAATPGAVNAEVERQLADG